VAQRDNRADHQTHHLIEKPSPSNSIVVMREARRTRTLRIVRTVDATGLPRFAAKPAKVMAPEKFFRAGTQQSLIERRAYMPDASDFKR
jgi:hypothetical protein